ncbi:hypothetical protein YYG_00011 [Plasmodium vinckei petteri]|uniref:Fam-a protein n=1 Tax=Plasmodium vinckei petteri TaxID=138298 RepID=W7AZK5_PLAVN|nr:hypothetical protein YYG_00011 [Plasmodium vinckei petteri]
MNKFYIQIVLFLLNISIYMNNKTLATEPTPGNAPKIKSKNRYATSEEIYEKNKNLLCTNPEEIKNAEKLMNEAVNALKHHATSNDGYKLYENRGGRNMSYYKKKHNDNTDVEKFTYKRSNPNKYNKIVGRLWDPDILNRIDHKSVKRKVARVYNPNLIVIQQHYKSGFWSSEKYFYALAAKFDISEEKTIIVMTSADINDHNSKNKKSYKNTIIESANSFTIEIDSEEDIKKGKLNKAFLNIAGCIVEKKDKSVNITYIKSISGIRILIT